MWTSCHCIRFQLPAHFGLSDLKFSHIVYCFNLNGKFVKIFYFNSIKVLLVNQFVEGKHDLKKGALDQLKEENLLKKWVAE